MTIMAFYLLTGRFPFGDEFVGLGLEAYILNRDAIEYEFKEEDNLSDVAKDFIEKNLRKYLPGD